MDLAGLLGKILFFERKKKVDSNFFLMWLSKVSISKGPFPINVNNQFLIRYSVCAFILR